MKERNTVAQGRMSELKSSKRVAIQDGCPTWGSESELCKEGVHKGQPGVGCQSPERTRKASRHEVTQHRMLKPKGNQVSTR